MNTEITDKLERKIIVFVGKSNECLVEKKSKKKNTWTSEINKLKWIYVFLERKLITDIYAVCDLTCYYEDNGEKLR